MTLAWFEVVGGLLAAFGLGALSGVGLLLGLAEEAAARRTRDAFYAGREAGEARAAMLAEESRPDERCTVPDCWRCATRAARLDVLDGGRS